MISFGYSIVCLLLKRLWLAFVVAIFMYNKSQLKGYTSEAVPLVERDLVGETKY